jgi:bacillithiol biosynthesis cysteine-adding enzyme BshC
LLQKQPISFEETGFFSRIILDYLSGSDTLSPFYTYKPNLAAFAEAMKAKQTEDIDRKALVAILQRQNSHQTLSAKTAANIQSFAHETTFCCVTAHQLNICTGPLYVIYKTLSVISLCEALNSEYPGRHFVPVYWLGSEDHDLAEIDHFQFFHQSIQWQTNQQGPVGRMQPAGMDQVLMKAKELAGESEHALEWMNLLESAYGHADTMAEATRTLLNKIFGEFGLVIIDGDDAVLKQSCANIIREELLTGAAGTIASETSLRLEKHYSVQAHPREINLFYMQDGLRERIIRHDNNFLVNNTTLSFSEKDMLTRVETSPECFSPNVILRPLFQQKVLPSLAYIGGGGEIAYWFQLKDLFQRFAVDFPVLVLRNSFQIMDKGAAAKWEKLGFQPADIFQSEHELIRQFIDRVQTGEMDLGAERKDLETLFERLRARVLSLDKSLESAVLAEKATALKSLERIEAKMLKAEKNKYETSVNQIKNIRAKMLPGDGLQERKENFGPLYIRSGKQILVELLQHTDPLAINFNLLLEV